MFRRQSNVQDECNVETVDDLLACVKRQVKQIMEEAVTKKFIHEDSSSVTTFCGAVEACLKYKLKKQTVNLFSNSSSTTALLHKVAKTLDLAKETSRTVSEIESQSDRLARFSLKNLTQDGMKSPLSKRFSNGYQKYVWIRVALFNKVLASIVSYMVTHNRKYYEPLSLMSDQSKGSLLAQLLEGPCALEYSSMKTLDHLYTDPNADELVLRHRLHSSPSVVSQTSVSSPSKRPALGLGRARCNTSSSSEDSMRSVPVHAREYVDSLHQNHKAKLLYGKNNVKVLPRDGDEPLPGYLSLHQDCEALSLKWTPNQLINSSNSSSNGSDQLHTHAEEGTCCAPVPDNGCSYGGRVASHACQPSSDNNIGVKYITKRPALLWDCAINVDIDEIVYLHCHHKGSCGGVLILVGVDGVQSPAFHFPFGGHLLAFLTCLESGLQPLAHLDPPLWIHKDTDVDASLLGKIFPKLRKLASHSGSVGGDITHPQAVSPAVTDIDYVFRIVVSYKSKGLHELIDPRRLSFMALGLRLPWFRASDKYSIDSQHSHSSNGDDAALHEQENAPVRPTLQTRDSLQKLCATMKLRILSRAFYGWLAHCRHLKTVREHLSGLVYNGGAVMPVPPENEKCLTAEYWNRLSDTDKVFLQFDIYRRIYYGGMAHDIRKHVWPYLLGHYKMGSTKSDRRKVDMAALRTYENTKDEWMSVEALIKQRSEQATFNNRMSDSDGEERADDEIDPSPSSLPIHNFKKQFLDRQTSSLSNESASTHRSTSEVFLDTVIVAEVGTEEFSNSTKPHPPLTKWHTVDSSYREDFCAVKMSNSYGGYRRSFDEFDRSASDFIDGGSGEEVQAVSLAPGSESDQDKKLLEEMESNLHRIDKDVHRCDRSYWYFTDNNLKKLRNVMCTYVWKNLDVGYVQGMCDLVAPLLVIFDDEPLTYSCFCELMKRMVKNFPNGQGMDNHLANMRSLIRVLDPELYDLMHHNGDYTHFFFCYRWLLLDFKREMCYDDVFLVWESIWAAKHVCSDNYVAFIALAMIESYRDILLDNCMDFIDVIKFFNEMAEKHNAREVLSIARDLVFRLQSLIENK